MANGHDQLRAHLDDNTRLIDVLRGQVQEQPALEETLEQIAENNEAARSLVIAGNLSPSPGSDYTPPRVVPETPEKTPGGRR